MKPRKCLTKSNTDIKMASVKQKRFTYKNETLSINGHTSAPACHMNICLKRCDYFVVIYKRKCRFASALFFMYSFNLKLNYCFNGLLSNG